MTGASIARRNALVGVCALSLLGPAAPSQVVTTYTYDALGRVTGVETVDSTETVDFTYNYDDANNRTSMAISGVVGPPSFSINNVSVSEGGSLTFTVTKTGIRL